MPYKVTITRGGNVLGSVTKPTQQEAISLFNKWYSQSIERIEALMQDNGYVQPEFRKPLSYALKPVYHTTCKIPPELRTEQEEYVLTYSETA